jgi:hypothetical protein
MEQPATTRERNVTKIAFLNVTVEIKSAKPFLIRSSLSDTTCFKHKQNARENRILFFKGKGQALSYEGVYTITQCSMSKKKGRRLTPFSLAWNSYPIGKKGADLRRPLF